MCIAVGFILERMRDIPAIPSALWGPYSPQRFPELGKQQLYPPFCPWAVDASQGSQMGRENILRAVTLERKLCLRMRLIFWAPYSR